MSLPEKIKATLAYFEIFDLALSVDELMRFMPGMVEGRLGVEKDLSEMSDVRGKHGFFVLKGSEELLENRIEKSLLAEQIKQKADKWKWTFGLVPFVEMACVCNYSSFDCVEKGSDIDLLILTKPGRIFLARLFLTLYMQLFGLRRYGDKIAGRFCLSFYVSEDDLDFEDILLKNGDIYFAYWLMALKPLFGTEITWGKIEKKNEWIGKYFDNFAVRRERFINVNQKKGWSRRLMELLLKGKLGNFIEGLLGGYFLKRHQKRLKYLPGNASVIVSSKMLKFHNNDKRQEFRESWLNRLEKL